MNICFAALDPFWGGLANNGGTRTILKSAEVLWHLGHRVDVVAVSDNFTWFEHPKPLRKIPKDADAVIAISVSDIKPMHQNAPKGARLFYWMRGYENWRMPEKKVLSRLKKGQTNIVNSSNLKAYCDRNDRKSILCYAGLDLPEPPMPSRKRGNTIGFLGRTMHATKRYDQCQKLMAILPEKQYKALSKVADGDLGGFYSNIGIWFAPTESEGFHNPPAEACLRGAVVVCNRKESNGMGDYATDETAMRYDVLEEAVEHIKSPDYSKVEAMQKRLYEIGDRKKNMERFVKILRGEI